MLYTVGGCIAGAFNHIGLVLIMRALVGVGVGIIMPLSTGLLAFYFTPGEQEGLMGYSSAMNQMGGVVATLLSGLLANISWRASFLVYLMGLISIVLCLIFLPNDKVVQEGPQGEPKKTSDVFKENYTYIVAMFLLMTTFFVYPANFAMETVSDGLIPHQYIAVIMAGMDFVAFFGGLLFVRMKLLCGNKMKFLAPGLFLVGYLLLALVGGWIGTLVGSACIGFANGVGIPFIISEALHALRSGCRHHSHAADFRGTVSGPVPVASADVHCEAVLRQCSAAAFALLFRRGTGLSVLSVVLVPFQREKGLMA